MYAAHTHNQQINYNHLIVVWTSYKLSPLKHQFFSIICCLLQDNPLILSTVFRSSLLLYPAGSQLLQTWIPQKSVSHQPAITSPLGIQSYVQENLQSLIRKLSTHQKPANSQWEGANGVVSPASTWTNPCFLIFPKNHKYRTRDGSWL